MSGFSSVDRSAHPGTLVRFLDEAAAGESGMKHYVGAAHAGRRHPGPVLDVGCGAGHDLTVLARFGLAAIGLDPSATMLEAAAPRAAAAGSPLVRAVGEALPFGPDVLAGCRIERVLMHVVDPSALLAEVVRCVRRGGLITVFEPDWTALRVTSDVLPHAAGWITSVNHPNVGGRLGDLLEQAGCDIVDRVEELSVWRSLATLQRVVGFPHAVDRAVAAGRLDGHQGDRWVREQWARQAAGTFHAVLPKVLMVAEKRSPRTSPPTGGRGSAKITGTSRARAVVVAYDAGWPPRAGRLITALEAALGGGLVDRIEHIGSTAIPGMAAKDVLDLQVSVTDLESAGLTLDHPLALLGFERSPHQRDHVPAGRTDDPALWAKLLWLRRGHPEGDVNLHVRRTGSANERMALLFRDWFRAHPGSVPAYGTFKLVLARATTDIDGYTDVKDPVVDLVVATAERWARSVGWPP